MVKEYRLKAVIKSKQHLLMTSINKQPIIVRLKVLMSKCCRNAPPDYMRVGEMLRISPLQIFLLIFIFLLVRFRPYRPDFGLDKDRHSFYSFTQDYNVLRPDPLITTCPHIPLKSLCRWFDPLSITLSISPESRSPVQSPASA